jgi:metallophosphoesterase (TIGR00282 family)
MSKLLRILYLGDVVGSPARDFIVGNLASIRRVHDIDVVVANGENATSGAGITEEHAIVLHRAGVDLLTLGDHVWDRHGFEKAIGTMDYVCRPANLPEECPGLDFITHRKNEITVGVCVVLGRRFMKIDASCPFRAIEKILGERGKSVQIVLVEVHAEATSEKIALGWNFDGRVTAILGSHTHVQTADERILPKGTAYITDLGMCGPHESVIGREIPQVLHTMKFCMPQRLEVATNDVRLHGVILTVDAATGLANRISRFSEVAAYRGSM